MKRAKTHMYSVRLFNNAGMLFPVCYAGAKVLDTAKSGLTVTGIVSKVTCKTCIKHITKG